MSKKIYVYNNGTCTRVKLYGLDVVNLFVANGYEVVDKEEDAQYIIINTCSFLKSKEEYFYKFIKNVNKRLKEKQRIVVIGCLPSILKDELLDMNEEMILFGRDIDAISKYFKFKKNIETKATTVSERLEGSKNVLYLFNKYLLKSKHIEYRLKREKVCYLQISSGCRGTCTYCSEKFTTRLKSRPLEDIIEAIYDGISRGYTLFGLNSDDASAYGKDIGHSLEELLSEIVKIKEDIYFSIPEFNPNGLSDKVISCLKDKKFLYITVPMQSGSQRILDLMERPYKIDDVIERVRRVKKNNKKLKINTHVIVGFPGETEEDFKKTKEILATGLFDRVKVFMYNERPGTKAALMDGKVLESVKVRRRDELLSLMKKQNIKHFSLTNLILNREQLK